MFAVGVGDVDGEVVGYQGGVHPGLHGDFVVGVGLPPAHDVVAVGVCLGDEGAVFAVAADVVGVDGDGAPANVQQGHLPGGLALGPGGNSPHGREAEDQREGEAAQPC